MSDPVTEGGCLCGAVRYRAQGEPLSTVYCHCSMCRRASGAPVVAWITFAARGFSFTQGQPRRYPCSAQATRQFCGQCGSALTFQFNDRVATDREAGEIDVTVATLDAPERAAPTHHVFEANRLPWLHMDDGLPRFAAFSQPRD